jgi:death-on-curing protein
MKRVTIEQVIEMHSALVAETGGLDGVRDMNLLDGSVNSLYHTFGGQNLYPILAMLVFLDVNGIPVHCSNEELITLRLAEGSIDEAAVIDWIVERS